VPQGPNPFSCFLLWGKGWRYLCVLSVCPTREGPAQLSIKNPEFQVDFYEYPKENATIAFHFPVYTSNVVVMNSIQKGLWNEKNVAFSALVLDNQYQVFVNGKSTYMFAHSLLPQSVKMVQVKGDTFLTSVDIL
uniref:Galectin n=1 Tax=Piliocolobus tephrosceles TaxID=591936 RepID=A0A8C9IQC3_9PRIM